MTHLDPETSAPIEEEYDEDDDATPLVDEPDNDPLDEESAEYVEPEEVQDTEGTERPEQDKHPED